MGNGNVDSRVIRNLVSRANASWTLFREACTRVFKYPAFHLRTGVAIGILFSLSRFFFFFFQPHRAFPRFSKKFLISPLLFPSPRHCNDTRIAINPRLLSISRCISRNSCRKKYSPGILFIAYFSFEQSRSSAINFDETSELSTKELLFIACVVSFISIHTYTHIYSLIRYFSTQLYIITTCVGKCSIQIRSIDIAGTEKKTWLFFFSLPPRA